MHLLTDICRWFIDISAATSILLAATLLAMFCLRQPARRQRLGEFALLGCLAIAIVQGIPGLPRLSLNWFESNPRATLSDGYFEQAADALAQPKSPAAVAQSLKGAAPNSPSADPTRSAPFPWREALAAIYLALAFAGFARFIRATFALRKLARTAAAPSDDLLKLYLALYKDMTDRAVSAPRLLISRHVDRPLTFGIRAPIILLPHALANSATPDELSAILRHELTHTRRRDARTWLLWTLTAATLGPNPLLLLLRRNLRLAQEFIADHAAANTNRVAYAEALMHLISPTASRANTLTAAAWSNHSDLYLRMRRLLTTRTHVDHSVARRWSFIFAALVLLASTTIAAVSLAGTTPEARLRTSERRGALYLIAQQETSGSGRGGWLTRYGPAPTALAVRALLQSGLPISHPAIQHALVYIDTVRQPDGGYYTDAEPTYHTAIVLSMFAAIDSDEARARIVAGRAFLQRTAAATTQRPGAWYASAPTPAAHGTFADPGERTADAVLDTYGSITYARWKSLVYAGLAANDPRVTTASHWLENHWTLDVHPGTGSADGLFYFYLAAARTLRVSGKSTLTDAHGVPHEWRSELQQKLSAVQNADGSWTNAQAPRWLEDQPEIVTAYALLSLQETRR